MKKYIAVVTILAASSLSWAEDPFTKLDNDITNMLLQNYLLKSQGIDRSRPIMQQSPEQQAQQMTAFEQQQHVLQQKWDDQQRITFNNKALANYKKEYAEHNDRRFLTWYALQDAAVLATKLNVVRKANYTDSLTKAHIAIESNDDFTGRIKAASHAYFFEKVLPSDGGYQAEQLQYTALLKMAKSEVVYDDLLTPPPVGAPHETADVWTSFQDQYPGVNVWNVWRKALAETLAVTGDKQPKEVIEDQASKRFAALALSYVVLKPDDVPALPPGFIVDQPHQ